jgi:hypothetical protein
LGRIRRWKEGCTCRCRNGLGCWAILPLAVL